MNSPRRWELRATTNLARLRCETIRRDEARATLAEIYNWFTEGFDTADLKDGKVLRRNWAEYDFQRARYQIVRTRPEARIRSSPVMSGVSRRIAVQAIGRAKGSTNTDTPTSKRPINSSELGV